MVLSYAIDRIASGYIMDLVQPQLAALGMAPSKAPELGPLVKAFGLALNVAALVVVYGLFGGGTALRAYFSERRRWDAHRHAEVVNELEGRVHEADLRLGVLQAQVEPHFLFNTLASVRALVRQDPAQAEATLDALVAFLRATIPKLRDDRGLHSTLGQQLDICASYLALMQVRMGPRLSRTVVADDSLRALPFPPSLLITLVENAIKHGIEPRPGPGRIEVSAAIEGERLRVCVADDGAGLQPGIGEGWDWPMSGNSSRTVSVRRPACGCGPPPAAWWPRSNCRAACWRSRGHERGKGRGHRADRRGRSPAAPRAARAAAAGVAGADGRGGLRGWHLGAGGGVRAAAGGGVPRHPHAGRERAGRGPCSRRAGRAGRVHDRLRRLRGARVRGRRRRLPAQAGAAGAAGTGGGAAARAAGGAPRPVRAPGTCRR